MKISSSGTRLFASMLLGTSVLGTAWAQDSTVDKATDAVADSVDVVKDALFEGWTGTASIGATSATGNAEATNINGSIRIGKTVGKWEHVAFGSVFKGTSAIVVVDRDDEGNVILDDDGRPQRSIIKGDNSDRLSLGYQPRYYWRPNTYFFGLLDYEQDEPANIDSATRQIIGVGHRFFSDDSGFLSGELGFGNKNTDLVFGDSIDGGIGYLGLNYLNRVSDNVTFNADLRSDFGSDNTYVELGFGVAFKISDRFALKLSHFARSNSDITSDGPFNSSSDSVSTINLVIDI